MTYTWKWPRWQWVLVIAGFILMPFGYAGQFWFNGSMSVRSAEDSARERRTDIGWEIQARQTEARGEAGRVRARLGALPAGVDDSALRDELRQWEAEARKTAPDQHTLDSIAFWEAEAAERRAFRARSAWISGAATAAAWWPLGLAIVLTMRRMERKARVAICGDRLIWEGTRWLLHRSTGDGSVRLAEIRMLKTVGRERTRPGAMGPMISLTTRSGVFRLPGGMRDGWDFVRELAAHCSLTNVRRGPLGVIYSADYIPGQPVVSPAQPGRTYGDTLPHEEEDEAPSP